MYCTQGPVLLSYIFKFDILYPPVHSLSHKWSENQFYVWINFLEIILKHKLEHTFSLN